MKQIILFGWAVFFLLAVTPACKKKKDGGGCGEATIKVTTSPANGTVDPPSMGPTFPVIVNITEGMPSSGVTIEVKARPDANNSTPFFTETRQNITTTNNNFTITGTPAGTSCIVDITVTSRSCNTNKWTGGYRFSSK
jgi:hypothetical protein